MHGLARASRIPVLAVLSSALAAGTAAAPLPGPASAARRPPFVVARAPTPIALDGRVDDAAWQRCERLPMAQLSPTPGATPTERTELLLAHDDRHLYVAGLLFDTEPSKIQSTTRRRDADTASAEWFGIVVDSFNDKENALAFFTTPAGLRWDAAVRGDGSLPLNVDWNTDWEVATSRNERGWFAEFRIPLASLRFQEADRRAVMGVIGWRLIARKNEVAIYPQMPDTWGLEARFKPSQAQEVVLEGVQGQRPLLASPYVVGGVRAGGAEAVRSPREAGLDVKYGVTSNLTLDFTANPDFAQVEADDLQANLTRFPLFHPEKRAFFQERGANFDFGFGGSDTVFYSRRVGLAGVSPVRILGGARVVGRVGAWDVGALDMQQAASSNEGGVNLGVARVRHRVLNASSYVGGIVASRVAARGGSNVAAGVDSLLRVTGDDYLHLAVAHAAGPSKPGSFFSGDATRLRASWDRRKIVGTAFYMGIGHAGRDYQPALGFEERRDFTSASASIAGGWIGRPSSSLALLRVGIDAIAVRANSRGVLESAHGGVGLGARAKSGYRINVGSRWSLEDVAEPFEIGRGGSVPAGRYSFRHVWADAWTPDTRVVAVQVSAEVGELYDGRRLTVELAPQWHPSADVDLSAGYKADRVDFHARRQVFMSHITRVRGSWTPATKIAVSALLQHSSTDSSLAANLRLRYNPREGVDLWLVYDRTGTAGNDTPGTVAARQPGSSTFLVKYAYTFRLAVGSRQPADEARD